MSTHNIQFLDKIRKYPCTFVFMTYRKNFVGTKNVFELAMVNEPSVFELLRFKCNCQVIIWAFFSSFSSLRKCTYCNRTFSILCALLVLQQYHPRL